MAIGSPLTPFITMRKTNTIIVGQGIAGSLVAYMLYRHKIPSVVIDPGSANTSSKVAAGMFTPVSGKRKTIHPITLEQIPYAITIYREIEQWLGIDMLHLQNIYQVYNSTDERNDLQARLTSDAFAKYIIANPNAEPGILQEQGAFEITHSGWLDCELFINGVAHWLKAKDALIEAEFMYQDMKFNEANMEYQGITCSQVVFCEGYRGVNNPFFSDQNIIPCKGDVLTIQSDHPATSRIVKKNGIYLTSLGNNLFKAGSTYQWNNSNAEPDEAGKSHIESKLGEMLTGKFNTIEHQAAIRPTTKNREVIAMQHPQHKGLFMLNGLGTKGVLQAPWFARHLTDLILH